MAVVTSGGWEPEPPGCCTTLTVVLFWFVWIGVGVAVVLSW